VQQATKLKLLVRFRSQTATNQQLQVFAHVLAVHSQQQLAEIHVLTLTQLLRTVTILAHLLIFQQL
jgi:hypothetical protein